MNRQTTKPRIAVVVAVATLLTDGAAGVLLVAEGSFRGDVISNVLMMVAVVCYAVVGALIARRLPRNVCGWLLLSIGLGVAVTLCTDAGSVLAQRSGQLGLATWLLWLNSWVLIPTAWVGIVWFFVVFPSGSPPSRRWRRFLTALIGVSVIGVTAAMVQRWDDDVLTNPLALPGPLAGTVFAGVAAGFGVALIISAGSVVRRLRCGGSQDRLALRWLAVVGVLAAMLLVTAVAAGAVGFHRLGDPLGVGFLIVLVVGLPASAAVALLMNRVSGIEVVAYRSVVYGSILSTITVIYAVLVGGIGAVVGRSERSDTLTAVAATAGAAVVFQPVRRRAQTFASRLVYGDRASPYELVATFSERLEEASLADVLPRMTALIAQGTGADRVWIWLHNDDELRRVAAWPPDDASGVSAPLVRGDRPVIGDSVFPVRHRGELLGAITIGMPPQEPLTPSTQRLLTDLSTQAGLVLRNVVLVQELKESRKRLVSSHDEARRRLERDLHDGAQQR